MEPPRHSTTWHSTACVCLDGLVVYGLVGPGWALFCHGTAHLCEGEVNKEERREGGRREERSKLRLWLIGKCRGIQPAAQGCEYGHPQASTVHSSSAPSLRPTPMPLPRRSDFSCPLLSSPVFSSLHFSSLLFFTALSLLECCHHTHQVGWKESATPRAIQFPRVG